MIAFHSNGLPPSPANRLSLDYRAEAKRLGPPPCPNIHPHAHNNGRRAAEIYKEVMDLYGIERVISQTQLAEAAAVRDVLGDRVIFVAIPEYMAKDKHHAFTKGFEENLHIWANEFGARMVKFWNAPRFRDFAAEAGVEEMGQLDHPARVRVAEVATSLGMMLMTHTADPDTWFKTMYADSARYGTKAEQYPGFERMMQRFDVPWLGAHMAGTPEDLDFLEGLFNRHPKLVVDTSACKWMIRELSKHPRDAFVRFFDTFNDRILYGSDIVTLDGHLEPSPESERRFGAQLASGEEEAFDLYASRYWAYRTFFETDYLGESNIADPDLKMVDPDNHNDMSAPTLAGKSLNTDQLKILYREAAQNSIIKWYEDHT